MSEPILLTAAALTPAALTPAADKPLWLWALFVAFVLGLMALDLGVFHRKAHVIGVRESLQLSAFYILVGLGFGFFIWSRSGGEDAMDYWTGFLLEKSLALDNIFVIALIFSYFSVPREYQHRVLFWGIIGVIILRGAMILAGAALVQRFEWVLWIFAAFLIYTGWQLLGAREGDEPDLDKNRAIQFLRRRVRVTPDYHGQKFFVRVMHPRKGVMAWFATPLFLALLCVEVADVIFAIDSVPAILLVTKDPYIVFTSNVMAILGLRALFFALAAAIARFKYLKQALSLVLIFIGGKVFVAEALGVEKVPAAISLGVTASILAAGVVYSLWRTRQGAAAKPAEPKAAK